MEKNQPEKSQAELYREERKERMAKAAKKKAKKSPQAVKLGATVRKVISIVLAVLVAIGAVGGILNFFGTPQKLFTAAKIGTVKASVAEYNYYYMDIYRYLSNQAQQYDSYYGAGAGLQYTGYDYTKTPMEQEYTAGNLDVEAGTTPTWADYLRINALNYLQSYISYSDLARQAGLTLTEEEQTSIDEQIETVRKTATDADYALDRYLTKLYGKGVNEKLLRSILEDKILAANYATQKQTEITSSITNDELLAEYDANQNVYAIMSLSVFMVTPEQATTAADATDEEKAAANAEMKAQAKTKAEGYLAKVTDAASVLTQAQAYQSSLTETSVRLSDTTHTAISNSFGSAVADWAISADRAVGDKAVIETDSGYAVAYMSALAHKNETKPVNVRHILIQFPTDSNGKATTPTDEEKKTYYAKAKAVYDEYQNNPTEETFSNLAINNSEDTGSKENGGLYEAVAPGDMVTEFNDWCFNPARQPGDTDIVETTYGYHVMYYVNNDNEALWSSTVKTAIANERFSAYDKETLSKEGKYSIQENKIFITWSARQLEKLIQMQYINS